jgi:hypothetical protein
MGLKAEIPEPPETISPLLCIPSGPLLLIDVQKDSVRRVRKALIYSLLHHNMIPLCLCSQTTLDYLNGIVDDAIGNHIDIMKTFIPRLWSLTSASNFLNQVLWLVARTRPSIVMVHPL